MMNTEDPRRRDMLRAALIVLGLTALGALAWLLGYL